MPNPCVGPEADLSLRTSTSGALTALIWKTVSHNNSKGAWLREDQVQRFSEIVLATSLSIALEGNHRAERRNQASRLPCVYFQQADTYAYPFKYLF